jgi:hypothetical protein
MSETFEALTEVMVDRLEKMGLYVEAVNVEGMPMSEEVHDSIMAGDISDREALRSGVADFHMMVSARIGDVAWSDRVLHPEAHRQNVEFEMMVPEETEIRADEIKKDLFEW